MTAPGMSYSPGWAQDAVRMMAARTAQSRAVFALQMIESTSRVLDIGCGPGSVTLGLAQAAAPGGLAVGVDFEETQIRAATRATARLGVDNAFFVVGAAAALPCPPSCFDVVFAHGVFEHLPDPAAALNDIRRVLVPAGRVAISSSDWSRAVLTPFSDDVGEAMAGHYLLRRLAGGDPFAGGSLVTWLQLAGFTAISTSSHQRPDLGYQELAAYVGTRLQAAAARADEHAAQLKSAARAARRWQDSREEGIFTQCWQEVTATAGT